MDVRVESQPGIEIKPPAFGQAVGDFLIRDYSERPAEAGAGERAPIPLSAGAGARRQAPDPIGVDRIRRQTPEFGTAGRTGLDRDGPAGSERHFGAGGRSTEPGESRTDVAAAAGAADNRDRLAGRGGPGGLARDLAALWRCAAQAPANRTARGKLRRRSRRRPWRSLLAENLPARGLVKEFYLRLTGIVRQYVEDTTGIRAPEQTTEEFLRDMRSRAVFSPERSVQLAEFLEAADMIKYAGQQPGGGSNRPGHRTGARVRQSEADAGRRLGRRRRELRTDQK